MPLLSKIRSNLSHITLIVVAGALVVIGGSISYYYFVVLPQQQAHENTKNTVQSLDTKAHSGDIKTALQGYDVMIKAENDQTQKKKIFLSKSIAAMNNNEFDEALSAAQSADSIQSDQNTLGMVAQVYEGQGNIKQALIFYDKAAKYAIAANISDTYYQNKVEELKGGSASQ